MGTEQPSTSSVATEAEGVGERAKARGYAVVSCGIAPRDVGGVRALDGLEEIGKAEIYTIHMYGIASTLSPLYGTTGA